MYKVFQNKGNSTTSKPGFIWRREENDRKFPYEELPCQSKKSVYS